MPTAATLARKGKPALQELARSNGVDPDQTVTVLATELAAMLNAADENTAAPEPIPESAEEAAEMGIVPGSAAVEPTDEEVLSVMEEQEIEDAATRKAAKVIFKLGERRYTYGELLRMQEDPDAAKIELFISFLDGLGEYARLANTVEKTRIHTMISHTKKFLGRIDGTW